MEEYIDVKFFLLKHKNENVSLKNTFESIGNLIKENSYYNINDIKIAYDLGKNDNELKIEPNDNILEDFIKDETIDNFINYISINGFFNKNDVEMSYNLSKLENNKKVESDVICEFFLNSFREHLITNYK